MTSAPRPGALQSVLCEGTDLDEYIQFSTASEKETFQNVSCLLDAQQLLNAQRVLLTNLDGRNVFSEVRPRRQVTTLRPGGALIVSGTRLVSFLGEGIHLGDTVGSAPNSCSARSPTSNIHYIYAHDPLSASIPFHNGFYPKPLSINTINHKDNNSKLK